MKTSTRGIAHHRIVGPAYGRGALDVDVEQHIGAVDQRLLYRGLERPVVIAVDERVLKHVAVADPAEKILFREKMIIDAVDFARPGRPRGARDGIDEIGRGPQVFAERGLAGAGGGGDDEENALAAENGIHSIF